MPTGGIAPAQAKYAGEPHPSLIQICHMIDSLRELYEAVVRALQQNVVVKSVVFINQPSLVNATGRAVGEILTHAKMLDMCTFRMTTR